MTITIGIKDLIYAIRDTSHAEVANIKDEKERYNCTAGLEKIELIKQCILEAYPNVLNACSRFIVSTSTTDFNPEVPDATPTIDDHTDIGINDFTFALTGGVRRFGGKGPAIGNKIREALKDYALSSFYTSVSKPDLSAEHAKRAIADIHELMALLRGKRPPVIITINNNNG